MTTFELDGLKRECQRFTLVVRATLLRIDVSTYQRIVSTYRRIYESTDRRINVSTRAASKIIPVSLYETLIRAAFQEYIQMTK